MASTVLSVAQQCQLRKYAPTTNYHNLNRVGKGASNEYRLVVSFDVSSLAGTYVESATLDFTRIINGLNGQNVTCYKMTHDDFVDTEATWNIYKTGSSWTTAGGDYEATTPAPDTIIPVSGQPISFDVGAIVSDAVTNSINANFIIRCDDEGDPVDYFTANTITVTVTYYDIIAKTQSDLVSSVTETIAQAVVEYESSVDNNNQAYILNRKTGYWTFQDTAPFTNAIYRPSTQKILGARRDLGQISSFEGEDFAGTDIASIIQTGYMNLGQFDEIKAMEDKNSEATKRLRAFFADCKGEGNLTLTIYTENDSTGENFTLTLGTTDNATLNAVRTALSRSLRGKYIAFKLTNSSGNDFFIGETKMKVGPKEIR